MFGQSKNKFDNILVNTFNDKKVFKKAFHTLLSGLRENKESREFFVLYSQVENKYCDNKTNAQEYLTEVVKTLKEKRKNLTLTSFIKKIEKFNKHIGKTTNPIYEELDLLIFNESVNKIEDTIKARKNLISYLTQEKSKSITEAQIPNSLLINIATKKFNEKFSSLTTPQQKEFKEIFSKNKNKIKEEYKEVVMETITKLDTLIAASEDKKLIGKLKETKDKIQEGMGNKSSLYKIKELNKTLL